MAYELPHSLLDRHPTLGATTRRRILVWIAGLPRTSRLRHPCRGASFLLASRAASLLHGASCRPNLIVVVVSCQLPPPCDVSPTASQRYRSPLECMRSLPGTLLLSHTSCRP